MPTFHIESVTLVRKQERGLFSYWLFVVHEETVEMKGRGFAPRAIAPPDEADGDIRSTSEKRLLLLVTFKFWHACVDRVRGRMKFWGEKVLGCFRVF